MVLNVVLNSVENERDASYRIPVLHNVMLHGRDGLNRTEEDETDLVLYGHDSDPVVKGG